MFVDKVVINAKSGRGGPGLSSFAHLKYHEFAGPDGGDGGKGGDVYIKVNTNLNSLYKLKYNPLWRAENGQEGMGKKMHGKNGEDVYIEVPLGTTIYNEETNELIADMTDRNLSVFILKGGKGGFGNSHFTSSIRQAPKFAELGDICAELNLRLEMKTMADVGIIGFPNAGKSTLISAVSNAKPKIADYQFTTLVPNLGVVEVAEDQLLLCDIPGLIEGASDGKGLGHEFLRHIERCSTLLHLIEVGSMDLGDQYAIIRKELESYSETLAKKPEVVAISKCDLIDEDTFNELITEFKKRTGLEKVFAISSASHLGLGELISDTYKKVADHKKAESEKQEEASDDYVVLRPHLDDPDTFDILYDSENSSWEVIGGRLEQIGRMTMWGNKDAEMRVYDILKKKGILKKLKSQGAEFGQKIKVGFGSVPYREDDE